MGERKTVDQALAEGRLLTRDELAYYWKVAPSTIDKLRRQGVIKSAIPLSKSHRYSLELIYGLPDSSQSTRKKVSNDSLKRKKSKSKGDSRKRRSSKLCL